MKQLLTIFAVMKFLISMGQIGSENQIKQLNDSAFSYLAIDRNVACQLANDSWSMNQGRFRTERARALLLIGLCQKYEGKMDSAYALFDEAREFFEKNDMQSDLARSYWYMGKIWHELNQFQRAKPFYEKSAQIYSEIDDFLSQFKVVNGMGVMESIQGNYTDGLDYFFESLELATLCGYQKEHYNVYDNIGKIYGQLKEYDKAFEFNRNAIRIADTTKNKRPLLNAYATRSELFSNSGNSDSALVYIQKAISLASDSDLETSSYYFLLSSFYDNQEDIRSSIRYLRLLIEEGRQKWVFRASVNLSEKYLALANLDSALHFGLIAYNEAKNVNLKSGIFRSALNLAKIYSDLGDFQRSNNFLFQYSAYRDSVYNDETTSRLSDMRVEIETLDKANEIAFLTYEKQLSEVERRSLIRTSIGIGVILILIIVLIFLWNRNNMRIKKIREIEMVKEIDESIKDLHTQTLHMIRLNNTIHEIEGMLESLKSKRVIKYSEVRGIASTIKVNKSLEREWDNFNQFFKNIHPGFIEHIKQKCSNLTKNEIRLCALLKMNLKNAEIASLLNIEQKSATMSKYRLKKKFGLSENEELDDFIQSIGTKI